MATRRRTTRTRGTREATADGKKTVVITGEQVKNVRDNAEFYKLECCAFIEFSGLDCINSVEDAVALRRVASGQLDGYAAQAGDDEYEWEVECDDDDIVDHDGAVIATSTQQQKSKEKYLEGAGFQRIGPFIGNSGNEVTLWAAQVLHEGVIEGGEIKETLVL